VKLCACSAVYDPARAVFIGWQPLGDGSLGELCNAPCCRTTFVRTVLDESARCDGCGQPTRAKTIRCGAGSHEPSAIYCPDCARERRYELRCTG